MNQGLWGIVSQVLNMGGNMLLGLYIARDVSPTAFGAWSTAYLVATIATAVFRTAVGTSILVNRQDGDFAAGSLGATLAVATSVGALLASGAAVFGRGHLRFELIVFALALPALLLQDALRHLAFARGLPRIAAISDGVWVVAQVIGFVLLPSPAQLGPWVATASWAVAAVIAAASAAILLRISTPTLHQTTGWLRLHGRATSVFGAEGLVSVASTSAAPLAVVLIAGYAEAGALRGALTLMGAMSALSSGLAPLATVRAARQEKTPGWTRTFMLQWSLMVLAIAVANGLAVWLMGAQVGQHLLGETWPLAAPVLLPLILQSMLRGPLTGGPIVLRVQRALGSLVGAAITAGILQIVFTIAGALAAWPLGIGAAVGAAYGILISSIISCLMYQAMVSRAEAAGLAAS